MFPTENNKIFTEDLERVNSYDVLVFITTFWKFFVLWKLIGTYLHYIVHSAVIVSVNNNSINDYILHQTVPKRYRKYLWIEKITS